MKICRSDAQVRRVLKAMAILVDTREQVWGHVERALSDLKCPVERGKLDQGDYTALVPLSALEGWSQERGKGPGDREGSGPWLSLADEVVVERKANLDELAGNLTVGRQRLEAEFHRAKALGIKVFLVVEDASWTDIWSHNYRSRLSPESLAATLLSWQARYNLSIVFCRPRETGRIIYGILYYWLRQCLEGGGKL